MNPLTKVFKAFAELDIDPLIAVEIENRVEAKQFSITLHSRGHRTMHSINDQEHQIDLRMEVRRILESHEQQKRPGLPAMRDAKWR